MPSHTSSGTRDVYKRQDENRLLHLLLDMGEMLLASGAEINRVEDTLQRIGRAYGAAKMCIRDRGCRR